MLFLGGLVPVCVLCHESILALYLLTLSSFHSQSCWTFFLYVFTVWLNLVLSRVYMLLLYFSCEFFPLKNIILFIYLWLHWVFTAARGLFLVAESWGWCWSGGVRASHCGGFSCHAAQTLGRLGFSSCRSRAWECGLSNCGAWAQRLLACGIFPYQGLNPCPLHWQAILGPPGKSLKKYVFLTFGMDSEF